ncbi:uncharacterized protein LOC119076334 [Bradysia coprophila]|uniref:uncharacterized protein LOC119076334 n=1 Tax=Bradysia coprophila TaxID=38358 RepID=UPI00187D8EED|nr:uncharacterized protein LOC119076334 [Bradysia coprophila]XP_037038913.1 uncharacterized protein LOC119076334 [Bradysia coprophila]XP_037038914.1 uncharacterized protein LOC119076334 [Bradysia coprophila]XP_037038915.1 uncharacterized protein LOC119076334 [Bradysia coprophila]
MSTQVFDNQSESEIDDYEVDEDEVLKSDPEDNNNSDLNNTVTNFGKLVVEKYIEVNNDRNASLSSTTVFTSTGIEKPNNKQIVTNKEPDGSIITTPELVLNQSSKTDCKRGRSANNTPSDSPNPAKKHCPIINMLPSMADALKADGGGHMVDIVSLKDGHPLTKDQTDLIKERLTTELFTRDNISNIKIEPPYFDGTKLRVICANVDSKEWLLDTVGKLEKKIEGIEIGTKELGVPPKMITVTITMPVKTYEPPVLFSIITAQNSVDTTYWRYMSRTKATNGRQTWFISVDETSLKQLKELGYRPYVGLDRIKFSVQNGNQK